MFGHKLGLRGPDRKDRRDFILRFHPQLSLLSEVDLSAKCPPIFDQGELGSCVANAVVSAMMFNDKNDGDEKLTELSRLMLYYLCRREDGTVREDAGTYTRTAIKAAAKYGVCSENRWPYKVDEFTMNPPEHCYEDARHRRIILYHRILTTFDMKACLMAGVSFVLGIPIFESFQSDEVAATGEVPMPEKGESLLGYHAVYCCGYKDSKRRYKCVNSWDGWGDKGFFTLPYEFIETFVLPEGQGDCWTIIK